MTAIAETSGEAAEAIKDYDVLESLQRSVFSKKVPHPSNYNCVVESLILVY
ncbi:MAG: hypothetical protein HC930_09485 [Hydrococcus sp. SU_1_0]|nr:hypothetical protein [Hydrococcus sp. SU_1_0]NJL64936.1 hypothetical protein [Candidatus Methylacidiphilales bacterium]NJR16224.1 hypothetical protein [Calothrix sp. CSU_2_0]